MKFLDNRTHAEHPGNITLSEKKLKILRPDLFGRKKKSNLNFKKSDEIDFLKECLKHGDTQPALVVSLNPLLVAAYTDEIDCVVLLNFPNHFINDYNLQMNSKLLSVNTYSKNRPYQKDLIPGPNARNLWFGFQPLIANFISDSSEIIQKHINRISLELWDYISDLGIEYLRTFPNTFRSGSPVYSNISAIQ